MITEAHPTISMHRLSRLIVCAVIAFVSPWLNAQDTNSQWPDSPSHARQVSIAPAHSGSDRDVTWRSLPGDFLRDQKAIWLFPVQLAKGHYWLPGVEPSLVVFSPLFRAGALERVVRIDRRRCPCPRTAGFRRCRCTACCSSTQRPAVLLRLQPPGGEEPEMILQHRAADRYSCVGTVLSMRSSACAGSSAICAPFRASASAICRCSGSRGTIR